MAGSIPNTINPATTSGTDLALILDDFVLAFASGNAGTSRPANLLTGGTWVDDSDLVANDILKLMMYNGTTDDELLTINVATSAVSLSALGDEVTILKDSDDAIGAVLALAKKRTTGSPATQSGDNIGTIEFNGYDSTGTDFIVSKIESDATEEITSIAQGNDLKFSTTQTGTSALVERLRILNNGNIGIGEIAPEELLHIKKTAGDASLKIERVSDDALSSEIKLKKERVSGGGEVQSGDSLGLQTFYGVDGSGVEYEMAQIESFATETVSSGNLGSKLVFRTKDTGTSAFVDKLTIDDDGLTIDGQVQSDYSETVAMAHGGILHDLFSVDSTKYGAFEATVMAYGHSTDTRSQSFTIKGIYNDTNWMYDYSADGLQGNDDLFTLDFTDASTLLVKYMNELDQGNFTTGTVFIKIKRFNQ
jgi:hypothetical protein